MPDKGFKAANGRQEESARKSALMRFRKAPKFKLDTVVGSEGSAGSPPVELVCAFL